MDRSRRRFLGMLAALPLVTGCATRDPFATRPRPQWPEPYVRPTPSGPATVARPRPTPVEPVVTKGVPLRAIPRSQWTAAPPIPSRLNLMQRVERVTVHHEGWTVVDFDDQARTMQRLETIRESHLNRMGAGDIGYHYIVDRAGRLWEGRPLGYQGAHVKDHNPHNIGVMVLGNFELQQPTSAQLATLQATLTSLMGYYRVPSTRLHTHQELAPTACPGKSLQPRVAVMRSRMA